MLGWGTKQVNESARLRGEPSVKSGHQVPLASKKSVRREVGSYLELASNRGQVTGNPSVIR